MALAGVLAWQSLFVRPDLNTGKTEPQETEEPTDPVEEIDWGEGTRPRSDGERKSQDYYTVLILGRDTGGGGNTDTMLLFTTGTEVETGASSISTRRLPSWWALSRIIR